MDVLKLAAAIVIAVIVLWFMYNLLIAYGLKRIKEKHEREQLEVLAAKERYKKRWDDLNKKFFKK